MDRSDWIAEGALAALVAFIVFLRWTGPAAPHEATNISEQPLGWRYGVECCSERDCAPIPSSTVKERPDGYHVTLAPGQHPMLKTKGYSGVIPYSSARPSPSGDFHICLSAEGSHRYCFYAGSKGF